ncbi:MAG: ABC transporter substrate-binding protein [Pseudomonadota bacterium]
MKKLIKNVNTNRTVICCFVACAFLASCNQEAPPEESLRIAFDGAPRTVDPSSSSSLYEAGLVLATYETLFAYDVTADSLVLVKSLASEWPTSSSDGLTMEVEIHTDSFFADHEIFPNGIGRNVTAEDVAYSILRHFDPNVVSQGSYLWRGQIVGIDNWDGDYDSLPEGIEVISAHTIRFSFNNPFPQFVHTLTTAFSAILPKEVATNRYQIGNESLGSGPYRISEMNESRAILIRNERYRTVTAELSERSNDEYLPIAGKQLPIIDTVVVEFIEEPSSRWINFQSGDLDVIAISDEFLDPMLNEENELATRFEELYNLHPYLANESILIRIQMDNDDIGVADTEARSEFNRLIRCAVTNAVDWERRNELFYGGEAIIFQGIVPPTLPEHIQRQVLSTQQRAAKATSFLQEAQTRDQLPVVTIGHTSSVIGRQTFETFRSSLIGVGFPPEKVRGVSYADFGKLLHGAREGRHQITQSSWGLDYGDASNVLQLFFGPNAAPGANLTNFKNEEYDRLFEIVRNMNPSEQRTNLVSRMQGILESECVYSGSVARERILISQSSLRGLPNHDPTRIGRYFAYVAFDTN